MPCHSVGQVFHTSGRDLYKSVHLPDEWHHESATLISGFKCLATRVGLRLSERLAEATVNVFNAKKASPLLPALLTKGASKTYGVFNPANVIVLPTILGICIIPSFFRSLFLLCSYPIRLSYTPFVLND